MKLYVIVWARVPLTLIHWAAAGAFSTPQDVTTSWLRCTPPCIRHSCPFLPHPVVWTFVPFVILLAQTIVPVSNSHIVAATINMGKYLAAPQKFITTYKIVALTKTPDNRYFEFDREESDKTTCKHSRSVLRRRPSAQFQLLYKFIWHVMHVIKRSYTARYFFFWPYFFGESFYFFAEWRTAVLSTLWTDFSVDNKSAGRQSGIVSFIVLLLQQSIHAEGTDFPESFGRTVGGGVSRLEKHTTKNLYIAPVCDNTFKLKFFYAT